jgi:hypothetical protein
LAGIAFYVCLNRIGTAFGLQGGEVRDDDDRRALPLDVVDHEGLQSPHLPFDQSNAGQTLVKAPVDYWSETGGMPLVG